MKRRPQPPKPTKAPYRNPFAAGSDWVQPKSLEEEIPEEVPTKSKGKTKGDRTENSKRIDTNSKLEKRVKTKPVDSGRVHNDAAPEIVTARFMLGATKLEETPKDKLPQFAFFGRSNVGKSSLLSTLMGRKGLVKISAAPGKTRELNFFLINDSFYFVDLPGIGYAKVSITLRDIMAERIREYVEKSRQLKGIVYLVDMRVAGTPLDIETVETLRSLGKPVLLVGSKRDKLSQADASKSLHTMKERFALDELPLALSSHTRQGVAELWEQIHSALEAPIE